MFEEQRKEFGGGLERLGKGDNLEKVTGRR
jgi:hypothetical protein